MKTILGAGAVFCGYLGVGQPFLTGHYTEVSVVMTVIMIACLVELGRELVRK